MAHELESVRIWLWNNPEGLHTTLVTNYGLPSEKRSFFALSGNNTLNKWKAYQDKQPQALQSYFRNIRDELTPVYRLAREEGSDVRISKLVRNTGDRGRRVLRGMLMLISDDSEYGFIMYLGDQKFEGMFDPELLSKRQHNAIGAYYWNKQQETQDWEEAF